MNKYIEVALVFLKLGLIGFGGPAAHIAMMEEEIVNKRKWMPNQRFLDLIGATNLIPGPNSTEMTMHCGYERAGIAGLFIAGISFIFPAVTVTTLIAWFYTSYGKLPTVEPFTYSLKAAVVGIIANALFKLGKKALKSFELGVLGLIVVVLSFLGLNEILVLLGAGLVGASFFSGRNVLKSKKLLLPISSGSIAGATIQSIGTAKIFWTFLKVGSVLYGSGYVLFAYLDAELVANGWLTREQLADAIAMGQFTPGPVLSTASFIGFQMNGVSGALAATLGIFAPSFFFVLVLNPLIDRMRKSQFLRYFLDAVNVAALAVMLVVLIRLTGETITDWRQVTIAVLSVIVVFVWKKVSSFWIILGASILGYMLYLL